MKYLLLAVLLAAPSLALADKPVALASGYRALSLPFPDHQLRWLEAGDRVDLMTTFEALLGKKGDESKEEVTATILQNVRVLAVDKTLGIVQLEVNPNEAQYAALFTSKTNWLSKRAPDDKEMKPMEMANARKLFR
ncbi:MAG: hypothetical protein HY923_06820 [Elusimicrobia bacterium]|nr:hypothetical protein [Elusimicrobiota bacterium]